MYGTPNSGCAEVVMNNINSESDDDYDDADERYFYRRDDDDDDDVDDEEWGDDSEDEIDNSVQKNHLQAGVSNLMFVALEGKHLKKLTLSETNLCSVGLANLIRFLGSNTTLQWLVLDKNHINSSMVTERFGQALRKHPQIEYLSLCDRHIGDDVGVLSDIRRSGLKKICLRSNVIGSRGELIISSYLTSNPPLESVNLERKFFNPLQRINNSEVAAENRRSKILLALRIADSQLRYFDGLPLELMRFIMKRIQQEVFTIKLTRIFQCMKVWMWIAPHLSSNQKEPCRSKRKRGSV